jgi:hypothetical protein
MTDYKALCAEVFAYHEGQDKYDFSHLNPYDRENAAFDAWQEIKAELKHALAQPEPEPQADGEVAELVDWLRDNGASLQKSGHGSATVLANFARAADLLERLIPPQPIPVSERLPGPEDCDAEGRCWWYGEGGDMVGWTLDAEGPSYYRAKYWLPAHALPVPPPND